MILIGAIGGGRIGIERNTITCVTQSLALLGAVIVRVCVGLICAFNPTATGSKPKYVIKKERVFATPTKGDAQNFTVYSTVGCVAVDGWSGCSETRDQQFKSSLWQDLFLTNHIKKTK